MKYEKPVLKQHSRSEFTDSAFRMDGRAVTGGLIGKFVVSSVVIKPCPRPLLGHGIKAGPRKAKLKQTLRGLAIALCTRASIRTTSDIDSLSRVYK